MLQKITLGRDAKTNNDEGKRDLPITRLGHHLSRFGVDSLNCLSPLGVIGFCLSRLPKEGENGIFKRLRRQFLAFPIGCSSNIKVSAKAIFKVGPCAFA